LAPVDDELDEAGALLDPVALALADDDTLFVGVDEDLAGAGEETVDAAAWVGAELEQVESGVAPTPFSPGPAELVLVLGLG
jgi:hypothetical protein